MRFPLDGLFKVARAFCVALAVVAVAQSAPPAAASGYTTSGVITSMLATGTWVRVAAPTITSNPDGCTGTGFFMLPVTHANYDALLSILLSAQVAQKEVSFEVSGCGTYPMIASVYIYS